MLGILMHLRKLLQMKAFFIEFECLSAKLGNKSSLPPA
ncbi:hypothetical protein S1OALGB6SA_1275 [Olavius algarvensis spirochete endosymbiont]|nr:hypothetical protein S1OALGB6SA_1275 [Olavius algarvensis spirochete endosymbiont]